MDLKLIVKNIENEVYSYYKYFHENPELSMKEFNTSLFVENILLKDSFCDQIIKIGKTGLLAVMKGEKLEAPQENSCILLRADMDALPITEDSKHFPCSKNSGIMHACGHDAHTAILLGVISVLNNYKKLFSGTIYFFFQPGEETLEGAKLLFSSDEVPLDNIDGVLALHVINELYGGDIGIKSGVNLASTDSFDIEIIGRGGHGAHSYTAIDPIVIGASIITQLQYLVSREVRAVDSAVVSVCSIHSAGDAYNIIPERIYLKGTIRTLEKEIRIKLQKRITELCNGVTKAFGASCNVLFKEGPPPLYNDKIWVERTKNVMSQILGKEHVKDLTVPAMGSEDFSYIKDKYPGVFVRIGCRSEGEEFTPSHNSKFVVDQKALTTGILTFSGVVLDFLGIFNN
ncbi:MAG: amidohydrolase [Fusobacteriaceae bacterium]|jgi:amidohydrolase|nr:amidohydrolase [Fusobacteriaceae bacterium]